MGDPPARNAEATNTVSAICLRRTEPSTVVGVDFDAVRTVGRERDLHAIA